MKNERWPNTVRKEIRYIRVRAGKEHTYKTVRSLVQSMAEDAAAGMHGIVLNFKGAPEEMWRRRDAWRARRAAYRARYRRRVTKLLKEKGIE